MLALSAAVLAAPPALAVDDGQIGIQPADEPDYFHLNLAPGGAMDETAIISNHTGSPVTLLTYPVDGLTTPQGGFGFAAQTDPRKNVGAWTELSAARVTVPAHSDVRLPFRLTVPPTATPGDYYGGLVIQSAPVPGKTVLAQSGTAVQLNIVQRQAVRVYLRVAGTRHDHLQSSRLTWSASAGEVEFSLPVRNDGNTTLHPAATLGLHSTIGVNDELRFNIPESLLPGEAITLHATLRHAPAVEVGTATVAERSEAGSVRLASGFTYIPWWLLVAGVAMIGLAIVLAVRMARFLRRARRAIALAEREAASGEVVA